MNHYELSCSISIADHTKTRNYSKMKRTFTTLAVLASLTAGGASAFGVNANNAELNSIEGTPAVADLSVGVKAVILSWMGFCSEEGRLYLDANTQLVTEPNEYG
jgi:uncharacterized protein YqiB (DUF1249 family)